MRNGGIILRHGTAPDAQTRGDRGLQAPSDWLFQSGPAGLSEAIVTTPKGVPALKALHDD
jgi:hypothetical protein